MGWLNSWIDLPLEVTQSEQKSGLFTYLGDYTEGQKDQTELREHSGTMYSKTFLSSVGKASEGTYEGVLTQNRGGSRDHVWSESRLTRREIRARLCRDNDRILLQRERGKNFESTVRPGSPDLYVPPRIIINPWLRKCRSRR